jgi:hypothetical protein
MEELPESISPCANVRKTCSLVMQDPSFKEEEHGRSVVINDDALQNLGNKIAESVLSQTKVKQGGSVEDSSGIDKCIHNLEFAAWDEEEWHYNGEKYDRPTLEDDYIKRQRFERVALYIMVMDCINFCFWPVGEENQSSQFIRKNLLEYEHLASALKSLAEADDNAEISVHQNISISDSVRAEDSYVFAPQNLIKLTEKSFFDMMNPLLPTAPDGGDGSIYAIPNVRERVRLLIEMGQSLLFSYNGSATQFIAGAKSSSDKLVFLILRNFPGFRDATVDSSRGRWVAFYKRAQILVADLWAALGSEHSRMKYGLDYCNFSDMDKITTFADYRVPQLLRNMDVLEYSPLLASKVDEGVELQSSSVDEVYIRASTVVAVDNLVKFVKEKTAKDDINAVKMDWYLWNIGEKLDRDGSLGSHHLVNTIFY